MSDDQNLLDIPVDTWPKGMVRKWLAQDPALKELVDVLKVHSSYLILRRSLQYRDFSASRCQPLR